MLHPEMSGADDLETALAGPLADHASVPLPAPASSNLPLKNGSQRVAFIIHFPPVRHSRRFSPPPSNTAVPLTVVSSICLVSLPRLHRIETAVAGGQGAPPDDSPLPWALARCH